ncbi:hypothetical protein LRP49_16660 [Enterovibrio sp. ZSDZ35]|uniref:RelA/SpoT domain-containing protein n=1 Tax=Enterovibrio qingdaonensis TaxID=2899818 RepID=A0ABT5QR86_9GAMM|nr:hypothetical protein [Enterovibrio sp. ZSDZ35]MDD1782806.1 hypothetical protein [Enterovibrio sp. ZSDZ35]
MGRMFKALIIVPILVIRIPAHADPVDVKPSTNCQSIYYQQPEATQQAALTELMSISSFRAQHLQQPYSDLSELYDVAPNAQAELETLASNIAANVNGTVLTPGIKGKQRATEKVAGELNGDASKLTDIVRVTIETDSIADLNRAFDKLASATKTQEVINRFQTPRPSGYRDVKVLVTLPETDLVAEVQLHLKAISAIKNGEEHKIYEQIQGIERLASLQKRDLTEWEFAKIEKLRSQSRALYDEAWRDYHPLEMAV